MAIFAAAAFAVGILAIAALDRIGAPDRLVRSLGPIFVLIGLAIVGLGARNADLASFMAARRGLPALYGALNLVAVAAGIALCLGSEAEDPPRLGVLAGVGLGAAGYGPLVRRFGASSLSDVVATRFSRTPARIVSALVVWIAAALTAMAGYRIAVAETRALVTSNRGAAETIVAAVLAISVAPGGLAGVVWCGAASGGALAMIIAFGGVAGWEVGVAPDLKAAVAAASEALSSLGSTAPVIATALAVGGLFAFEPAAIASPDVRTAAKAGLGGFILCAALAVVASAALSVFSPGLAPGASVSPIASSLLGAAALAAALALARAGVHMSSRAFGVALADPPRPYPPLASVRLARMRAAQLAVVLGSVVFDREGFIDGRTGLIGAMALSLALTTPIVALAAIGRAGPASASVATLVAVGVCVALFRGASIGHLPAAADLFEYAVVAAAAGFAAGSLTCLVAPRRNAPPTPAAFDPFSGPSG